MILKIDPVNLERDFKMPKIITRPLPFRPAQEFPKTPENSPKLGICDSPISPAFGKFVESEGESDPVQNPVRVVKDEEIQSDISINPKSENLFFTAQNNGNVIQDQKKKGELEGTQTLVSRHSKTKLKEEKSAEVLSPKDIDPKLLVEMKKSEKYSRKKIIGLALTSLLTLIKLVDFIIRNKVFSSEAKT